MKNTLIVLNLFLFTIQINAQDVLVSREKCEDSNTSISKSTYSLPQFPGGDLELSKYLTSNIRYPRNSNNSSSRGKVIVCFKIKENGEISDVNIIEGVNKLLNKEAKRVVENMPKWKPAYENGIAVSNLLTIPIVFYRI